MHYDFLNTEFNKSKILERTEKASSKAPSMRKKCQPMAIEAFNSEPGEIAMLPQLTLPKRNSISREEFDKRILQIDTRNHLLN